MSWQGVSMTRSEIPQKIKKQIEKTLMLKRYLVKFALRIIIFLAVFIFYLQDKETMYKLMNQSVWKGITPLHVLWAVFMLMMIKHLFPSDKLSMAIRKAEVKEYEPVEEYEQLELLQFVQKQNIRAWYVMLSWLLLNGVFGILYILNIIDNGDLLMLTVFFFLCDYICILIYCPFQSHIMKNRCCVNCRIYDWGHFMMFTPMLFIRNFFSWSLFFTSCVVLIQWEIKYAKHPERFWHGSNKHLQCSRCNDKICQIKGKVIEK